MHLLLVELVWTDSSLTAPTPRGGESETCGATSRSLVNCPLRYHQPSLMHDTVFTALSRQT